MLPPFSTKSKKLLVIVLWIILNTLIFLNWADSPRGSTDYDSATGQSADFPGTHNHEVLLEEHPIQTLVREAEIAFEAQLARQSKTYETAASEYSRRYWRDPPPGFATWYEYAIMHDSLIIDDFDIINQTLSPFWSLSGGQIKRRLDGIRDHGPMIWHCEIHDGQLSNGCECLGEELLRLLRDATISPHLPTVDLLINALDEPRILPGGKEKPTKDPFDTDAPDWTDLSHKNVWDRVTAVCRQKPDSFRSSTSSLNPIFEANSASPSSLRLGALDLCRHPEYNHMHGLWTSPMSFEVTHSLLPILSPAVPSTMGDIPFPPAAYTDDAYAYVEVEDMPWNDKTAGLYWSGKTTGSFQRADSSGWKQHHRQRFVGLFDNRTTKIHSYLARTSDGKPWRRYNTNVIDQALYNVHFTGVVQCEDKVTCDAVQEWFEIRHPEPRSEAFKFSLVFDLDGNGHSGRFYRLLNSRSLPLKQTVFREWHDERLQPWLHYVPISLAMGDLPEVVRYLVTEEEGKRIAALMAEKGRQWSLRALRPVDQAIYLYRLMLELSYLQDPTRPAL